MTGIEPSGIVSSIFNAMGESGFIQTGLTASFLILGLLFMGIIVNIILKAMGHEGVDITVPEDELFVHEDEIY